MVTTNSQQSKRAPSSVKKTVKHSKKFARTQTGCLQCRQKKKKCDGKRPSCHSCDKRGITCEFPANIRFFQFQYDDKNKFTGEDVKAKIKQEREQESKTEKLDLLDTVFQIDLKQIELPSPKKQKSATSTPVAVSSPKAIKPNFTPSSQLQRSTRLSLAAPTTFTTSVNPHDIHVSRSSSLTSIAPSLMSDYSDSETNKESIEDTEEALHLANYGESIDFILNNITIDLISKSISNLQYIDFDTRLNSYYEETSRSNSLTDDEIGRQIKEGLQFIEKNSCLNFKPDEIFSFENAEQ